MALVSMRWDGTDRRAHIKVTGYADPLRRPLAAAGPANEVIISPDGDQALARRRQQARIWFLSRWSGGATPTVSIVALRRSAGSRSQAHDAWAATSSAGRTTASHIYWSLGHSLLHVRPRDRATRDRAIRSREAPTASPRAGAPSADTCRRGASGPRYEPTRHDVAITVARRIEPTGVVALRGARIVTMKGDEVIERGDIVVTNNRIAAVGAAGKVTDASGRARDRRRPARRSCPASSTCTRTCGRRGASTSRRSYEYLVNLAYGVTTTRDPQTSTTDVLTYGDLVETGDMIGPRISPTGPGRLLDATRSRALDDARDVLHALHGVLQHEDDQAVHGRRPRDAAVDR